MARCRIPPKKTLRDVLTRAAGKRTVLGVALPVLYGTIEAARNGRSFDGLTAAAIQAGFDDLGRTYLWSQFHTTYLVRPLGTRGFLDLKDGFYRFRPHLVDGITTADLEALHTELVQSLRDATERRRAEIERLELACRLPIDQVDSRREIVKSYLSNFRGNLGENFEVITYAVLREYFAAFGFRIQRFSTTHANDGGIDYVGGDRIYQVSTDGGLEKLQGDLAKAPNTARVVVRPKFADDARRRADDAAITRVELSDLLAHFVGWLLSRDMTNRRAKHLQGILQVALSEFRREELADRTTDADAGEV